MAYQRPGAGKMYVWMGSSGLNITLEGESVKFTHDADGRANARAVLKGLKDFCKAEKINLKKTLEIV